MMFVHIGQTDVAERLHNAWLRTIEDGVHTADIYKDGASTQLVGTREFADAVIRRVGQAPQRLAKAAYASAGETISTAYKPSTATAGIKKETVGVDVFLEWTGGSPDKLGVALTQGGNDRLALQMITNRGVKVFPGGMPETFCTDHWRCRFIGPGGRVGTAEIADLLVRIDQMGFDVIKLETLCNFGGEAGYSLGQGQ
jgi:isocitrate dehydrogenase